MKARSLLLVSGGAGLGLSLLLLGLVGWALGASYDWDLARCRALPDHYAPELAWLFVITPIGILGAVFAIAAACSGLWARPSELRVAWIIPVIGFVIVGAGLVLAAGLVWGPCPSA